MPDRSKERLAKTIDYITWFQNQYGFSPSYRSIGKAIGVSSPSTVHGIIKSLERQGRIARNPANNMVRVVNNGRQDNCVHDWRVRKSANPLKLLCADCGFTTEVEYDPNGEPKSLLKYTGKVN